MSRADADGGTASGHPSLETAQREGMEAELRRTNQELRAIYENMCDGVLIADSETRHLCLRTRQCAE